MTSDAEEPDASIARPQCGEIDHVNEEFGRVKRTLEAPEFGFAAVAVDDPSAASQRSWFVRGRRTTHL